MAPSNLLMMPINIVNLYVSWNVSSLTFKRQVAFIRLPWFLLGPKNSKNNSYGDNNDNSTYNCTR